MAKWHHASPWSRTHTLERDDEAPRWSSLAAALRALVDHEQTGRDISSATGGMLDRAERHEVGQTARDPNRLSRQLNRALDIAPVRVALDRAYAGGRSGLAAEVCMRVLLERTEGVLLEVTPYEVLAARYGIGTDALKGIASYGRRVLIENLSGRGLVPAYRRHARVEASVT